MTLIPQLPGSRPPLVSASTRLAQGCELTTRTGAKRRGKVTLILFTIGLTAGLLSTRLATAQTNEAGSREPLTIGVLLPPEEPQTRSLQEGILLAREAYSKKAGKDLRIKIRGRVGQWGADAVEAAQLVTDDSAMGLITPPDGAASHVVLQVSGRTAVPVVTLCGDGSVGRTGVPWLIRIVPRTEEEVRALSDRVAPAGSNRTQRWMAVVPSQRPGREIGRDLAKGLQGSPPRLAQIREYSTNNAGLLAKELQDANPDAILIWLPPTQAASMVLELRKRAYHGALAGPGVLQCAAFLSSAGGAAEGFLIPAIARNDEDKQRWSSFASDYQREWGRAPDVMAGLSYDAVLLLAELLDHSSFRATPHALPHDFKWSGVTGTLSFDKEGNRKVEMELLQVSGGRFVLSTP